MVERVIISSGAKGYFFTITNAQGDVIGIRNSTGAVIARYNYDAFGKLISTTDDSGNILTGNSFATQINVRYRGYYYDSETGLYYLQSRYYDPETGRFLNADDVNFLGATETLLSYNAFAYCENDVVNKSDPGGASIAAGLGATFLSVAMFFVVTFAISAIVLNSYNTSFGFQRNLNNAFNNIMSPIVTMKWKIDFLNNLVRTFSQITVRFIEQSISVAMADVKIRQRVKKNSKDQYWSAQNAGSYVIIGNAITYKAAVNRVMTGKSVFTTTRLRAKQVAKSASMGKAPIHHDKHKDQPGYYKHYHVSKHRNSAHVWYLF